MKTEFYDHSLQYLTEVWKLFSCRYLIPNSPPTALLDRVHRGCLSVTWLIPSNLIPTLVKTARNDAYFFHKHHILRVTVGDDCVYEELAKKSTAVSSANIHMHKAGLYCLNKYIPIYIHKTECKHCAVSINMNHPLLIISIYTVLCGSPM